MAAANTTVEIANVGDALVITGTGFQNTHAYTVTVSKRGAGYTIAFGGTTSGGGAVDTTGKLTLTLDSEGIIDYTISDGASTLTGQVQVWRT